MDAVEVCHLAQNLARNCGYAVFPVGEDKRPTLKDWPNRASTDPEHVAALWRGHPGPLIGIATGALSGVSVLDIDRKHPQAALWWRNACSRLLPTQTYETRSGGLHAYFRHIEGVRNSQGRICKGIDTRGEGGYIISWFAAGFGCFDHTPPQPWPAWLLAELTRPVHPAPARREVSPDGEAGLEGIVRCVRTAAEGERNAILHWAACRCADRHMRQADAEALLIAAAGEAGLPEIEARRTIASAMGRAA